MIRMLRSVPNISFRRFYWWCAGRVKAFEEDAEAWCSTFGFLLCAATKAKETSEAQIALATHMDMVNELLSAGPSNQQNELKPEPCTKDVGIQCGKHFTVYVHAVVIL